MPHAYADTYAPPTAHARHIAAQVAAQNTEIIHRVQSGLPEPFSRSGGGSGPQPSGTQPSALDSLPRTPTATVTTACCRVLSSELNMAVIGAAMERMTAQQRLQCIVLEALAVNLELINAWIDLLLDRALDDTHDVARIAACEAGLPDLARDTAVLREAGNMTTSEWSGQEARLYTTLAGLMRLVWLQHPQPTLAFVGDELYLYPYGYDGSGRLLCMHLTPEQTPVSFAAAAYLVVDTTAGHVSLLSSAAAQPEERRPVPATWEPANVVALSTDIPRAGIMHTAGGAIVDSRRAIASGGDTHSRSVWATTRRDCAVARCVNAGLLTCRVVRKLLARLTVPAHEAIGVRLVQQALLAVSAAGVDAENAPSLTRIRGYVAQGAADLDERIKTAELSEHTTWPATRDAAVFMDTIMTTL